MERGETIKELTLNLLLENAEKNYQFLVISDKGYRIAHLDGGDKRTDIIIKLVGHNKITWIDFQNHLIKMDDVNWGEAWTLLHKMYDDNDD